MQGRHLAPDGVGGQAGDRPLGPVRFINRMDNAPPAGVPDQGPVRVTDEQVAAVRGLDRRGHLAGPKANYGHGPSG